MEENEFPGFRHPESVRDNNLTERSARFKSAVHDEKPTCAVCMEVLGTHGGPASLSCGHNGCLECLQQVQIHSNAPVCPLCRTPFDGDINLALNLDLRAALECAEAATAAARAAEDRRLAVSHSSNQTVRMGKENSARTSYHYRFAYDLPYQEETGPWIPVSVPPKGSKDFDGPEMGSVYGDVFPEASTLTYQNREPEINLWNVLSGFIAIISGGNSSRSRRLPSESISTDRTVAQYGDSGIGRSPNNSWSGNPYRPSAPPLILGSSESGVGAMRAVLEAEPPDWMPDSAASSCMLCGATFRAVTCGRHHCRFCGGIFCRRCSGGRCLLPVKFRDRDPQRVCDTCWERLEPVQKSLADRVSNAAQIALNDVTDYSCMKAWVNSPVGLSMEQEIFKATNTLRSYLKMGTLTPERSIPDTVLKGACGLAIITVVKAGFMLTYKFGTGLVVSRTRDGWSAPSAIASCGLGWGVQAGGELTDFILVLRTEEAVKAFSGRVLLSVGAGLSVAAGPVGRVAEADLRAGDGGAAACFTYSRSKGAFIGCSVEGNFLATRTSENTRFYGDSNLTAVDILLGAVPRPRAAGPLYNALDDLFMKVDSSDSEY